MADYLLDNAKYDRAEPLIDEIIDIREENHVDGDLALPNSLLTWCKILKARAQHQGIIDVSSRAEKLFNESSPPVVSGVVCAISMQAQALQEFRRYTEAEPLMRRSLAIVEHSYGAEHPMIAVNLNNLASLLQATNRLTEAEPLRRRALSIDEHSYGTEHPKVAIRLNNLSTLLFVTNRLSEADGIDCGCLNPARVGRWP